MAGIKDKFGQWIWLAVLAFLIYAFIEANFIHQGDWDYGSGPPDPEYDPED